MISPLDKLNAATNQELRVSSSGPVLQPDENGRRAYVITLKNYDDLDSFYNDMETPGGNLYIPNRQVQVENRLPSSRNTIYRLSEAEAEQLKNDPRVLDVEVSLHERGLAIPHQCWTETSDWDRTGTVGKNWALLRVTEGIDTGTWGQAAGQSNTRNTTVKTGLSGKNVDIVVCDGAIDPTHPEYAVNPDGTGGSRVVQYNWYGLNPYVNGTASGTYSYSGTYDNHGMNVTSIAAGNTNGWAKSANIYNLDIYAGMDIYTIFNYVKEFHKRKPVNPETGRKNPTICTNSWGLSPGFISWTNNSDVGVISEYYFKGTSYYASGANIFAFISPLGGYAGTGLMIGQLTTQYGIYFPTRSSAMEADIEDCVKEGIIMVGAAGNEYSQVHSANTNPVNSYNDYLITGSSIGTQSNALPNTKYYPKRGNQNATQSMICVGNVGARYSGQSLDYKSMSSNYGNRIDVWSPGENIRGASAGSGTVDARNASYYEMSMTGTSQATPQVTGVLACMMEDYNYWNQQQAKDFLINSLTKPNQVYNPPDVDPESYPNGCYYSLNDSPNRYLYFKQHRLPTGMAFPGTIRNSRPTTGQVYPRTRIYKSK